ncbi:MAG: vanadium-dependent haloperoxidase [Nannocystaceae bacterium]
MAFTQGWGGRARAHGLVSMLALAAACRDEHHEPIDETWRVIGSELEIALLGVSGTASDDVWVVGADAGKGGVVAHFDGTAWTRMDSGQLHDLWWVFALDETHVFVAGAEATILRYDGAAFVREATPGRASHTVYGLWGAAPDDVWAVGGQAGRYGFLWHFDGSAWTDVPLPDDVPLDGGGELPGLFKVWGRASDDIYAVGGHGLMLHYDGTAWSVIPTETDALLFTVHGNRDSVVVVGGGEFGVVLDGEGREIGPEQAPLLQGVHVEADGTVWASGARGTVLRRRRGHDWETISTGLSPKPESLHALWVDPDHGLWTVGGGVLTPALDQGVLFHRGAEAGDLIGLEPDPPPEPACPEDRIDIVPGGSIARRWNELLLDSIRRDVPKPGVHARNLFHTSAAMYDAWASYDTVADGYYHVERSTADDVEAARQTAISYAVYRVLVQRYTGANGGPTSVACYDAFMDRLGLDPGDTHTDGDDPIAVGNRVGAAVIAATLDDGANEANMYADTTGYAAVNPPLTVDRPGTSATEPDRWQELNLARAETQNGIVVDAGLQKYIGPNWGHVAAFALPPDDDGDGVHHEVDVVPSVSQPEMVDWVVDVLTKTAALDHQNGTAIDISPGAYGNNPLGSNDGTGHTLNPVTGEPYPANIVPMGDFARVLAEFWADGPKSETPPGHWNTLANTVSDALGADPLAAWGEGMPIDRLQWDVQLYFALNAAVHDAAITAWGIKRAHTTSRPITLVRWMAGQGQSSDPALPSYSPHGLPLVPGAIELITEETTRPGERHHHLRWWKGQVAVFTWLGEPGDRANEVGGLGWMRAVDWFPYQRRTFVTPAFPGLISGHSTFSRAAAEVLTAYTGSEFFPGGLGSFTAKAHEHLVFEDGPSVDVVLQWASYYDAADQAGQSRIYGGIHIWPDDYQGRVLGSTVGTDAAAKARTYFDGTAVE